MQEKRREYGGQYGDTLAWVWRQCGEWRRFGESLANIWREGGEFWRELGDSLANVYRELGECLALMYRLFIVSVAAIWRLIGYCLA